MARISTPAVTTRMYRHFAVVTLVATLLVALFANGENRQAMAQAVEDQKFAAHAAEFKDYKYGKPHFVETKLQARVYNRVSDYTDTDPYYGAPVDRIGSREGASSAVGRTTGRGGMRYVPASYAARQLTPEELARLTPEQREALLEQLAAGGSEADPGQRQRQINSLVAASAQRAGSEHGIE